MKEEFKTSCSFQLAGYYLPCVGKVCIFMLSSTGVGCSPDELTMVNGEQALNKSMRNVIDRGLVFIGILLLVF